MFRIVDGEILNEEEYPLVNLKNLTDIFNVKIICGNNKFKVKFNDDTEGSFNLDPNLLASISDIQMIGSFDIISAGYTGDQVSYVRKKFANTT